MATTGGINTTTALVKLVVPADGAASHKALGDEVKILLKDEVGEDTCDGLQLITGRGHVHG